MNTLFNIDSMLPPKPEPGKRCRNCVHLLRHKYNTSYFYCGKQHSKMTNNGYKKIKANDPACQIFEPIKKEK